MGADHGRTGRIGCVDDEMLRADLAAVYPQFGLRLAHAGLVLVPPTDVELFELAAIVGEPGGVVDDGEEHFLTWPTGDADAVDRFLRFHWSLRVRPSPAGWLVPFAVVSGGRAVGVVGLGAPRWPGERVVDTRAWIARTDQGHGLGRRCRAMLLELAFAHLGVQRAVTAAARENAASRAVSKRLGYRETGEIRGADGVVEVHASLTPAAWRRRRLPDVDVDGVEPFLAALEP
jgi:RimJ/RimL family protein N-acetyltransferase